MRYGTFLQIKNQYITQTGTIMTIPQGTRSIHNFFSVSILKKAFLTACVVGSILTAINHGDLILSGNPPPTMKILLTYCVPFCVTIWGSYIGKKQNN
jgi:methyl-accepting chemotaxis protein